MTGEGAFKGSKLQLTTARIVIPVIIFLLTAPLVFWINSLLQTNLKNDRILQTAGDMATVQAKISSEINTSLHLLHGLSALIQANPDLSTEEFETYAAALYPKGKGIISIAVAPDYVIKFIYPSAGNSRALGLDYRVTPDQWIAVEECVKRRNIVVAGPLTLVQGQTAVVGRSPVFITNPETGHDQLWGIVSMPMSFDTLIDNSELNSLEQKYDLAIRGRDSLGDKGEVFYGDPEIFSISNVSTNINLPTGYWEMAAAIPEASATEIAILVAFNVASIAAILLLCLVAFLLHKNILVMRNSERSLRKANRSIEKRYTEISLLNRDLEAFNYSISNTLKTPLRHIAGYSKLLCEDSSKKLDDEVNNSLQRIYDSTEELNNLLNSLHRLSRAARQGLECSKVCIQTIAVAAFKKAREQYQTGEIELIAEGDFSVNGDFHLLKIAVDIIIDNAVKFTSLCKNPKITLQGIIVENKHVITISDNGPGFESSAAEAIFVPYHSYHTHGDFSGIGLGLATARRIIERHGGIIRAKGKAGEGATFTITLPQKDCSSEEEQSESYPGI
jgi:sensor domain CHASE-containing protein